LLLTPEGRTKHVVAEVYIDGRWAIVDPDYHLLMKDARGNLLTSKDLQNQETLQDATSSLRDYRKEYTYDRYAHVRLAALPFNSPRVRSLAEWFFPDGEQYLDWSLLIERRSFLYLSISVCLLFFLALLRTILAFVGDHYLHVPRFHLLTNLRQATVSFFKMPETK
jgi:hypothetical protein